MCVHVNDVLHIPPVRYFVLCVCVHVCIQYIHCFLVCNQYYFTSQL